MFKKVVFIVGLCIYAIPFAIANQTMVVESKRTDLINKIGEVKYYPRELIASHTEAYGPGEVVQIPHAQEEADTFGTYIVLVQTDNSFLPLTGLLVNGAKFSHAIFINGRLVSKQGSPGLNKSETIHRYLPSIVPLPNKESIASLPDSKKVVEVAIQTANFTGLPGGLDGPLLIGDFNALFERQAKATFVNIITATVAIVLSVFFLISFIYGRDVAHLALSLAGVTISIRQIVIGHESIRSIISFFNEVTLIAVDYSTPYFLASFFALFTLSSLKTETVRYREETVLSTALIIITVGMPILCISLTYLGGPRLLHDALVIVVLALLVIVWGLHELITHKRKIQIFDFLHGYLLLIAMLFSVLWDVSIVFDLVDGQLISTYTLIAMMFLQVLVNFKEGNESSVNYKKAVERYEGELIAKETAVLKSQQVNDNYRHIAEEMVKGKENELTTMAREIHDAMSKAVTTAIRVMRESKDVIDLDHRGVAQQLEAAQDELSSSYKVFRALLHHNRPADLDMITLSTVLERQLLVPKSVIYDVAVAEDTDQLNIDSKINIFRICQEAATNMIKYSNASLFQIYIDSERRNGIDIWTIKILDNGDGVDLTKARRNGLDNIEFRFELMKGKVDIHTSPGNGFIYDGWIPKIPNKLRSMDEEYEAFRASQEGNRAD
ncbi:sensor histidine kinase [Reinekea sp. G2M2-21]|uniref:sensor histidine kinase n=1 Tax=Reinekea sp. G2M2-21 TaxID=2788942 RepID=UPI0018AB7FA6|nr:histidine kinase [Reinekea sp. G2M2-21]